MDLTPSFNRPPSTTNESAHRSHVIVQSRVYVRGSIKQSPFWGISNACFFIPATLKAKTLGDRAFAPVNSMLITGTITAKQKVRQQVPGLYAVCRYIPVSHVMFLTRFAGRFQSHVMFLTRSDNNIIGKRTV